MKQSKPLPFVFIHIPKTAGTSIRHFLQNNFNYNINTYNSEEGEIGTHNCLFEIENINNLDEKIFVFAVCRNPYRRIYSYYKYFITEEIISKATTFEEYLKIVDSTPFKDIKLDCVNQGRWLITKNNYPNKKIYYFEKLVEFEKDFNCILPHQNKTNFEIDLYRSDYTDECKKRVFDICYDDFLVFDYSFDWKNSLGKLNYNFY